MRNHLEGRVVVITGAGSGFGRLIAQQTAELGAKVVAGDVDAATAEATAASITDKGGEALGVAADVTDRAAMAALVATAVGRFGAVDVLVNNAGVMPLAFFSDHERAAEAWDRCIDINLKGVLHGISAAYDQMLGQGRGHIVNISSIYGNAGSAGSGVYSATKAAVRVLSDALRVEAQGKIKVTVVRPTGVLGTGLSAGVINQAATLGLTGHNTPAFNDRIQELLTGRMPPSATDPDDVGYWMITPEDMAEQVVHAINQPWGVTIADVTIRATGEHYVL